MISLSLCTYIYIYHIYIYIYTYVCVYVHMYVCTYVRTYVHTHVCMYVCMYVCIYVCMYLCMYVCMYIIYVCMCIYIYIYTHLCLSAYSFTNTLFTCASRRRVGLSHMCIPARAHGSSSDRGRRALRSPYTILFSTSRFVRVILAQEPSQSSLSRSNFNG